MTIEVPILTLRTLTSFLLSSSRAQFASTLSAMSAIVLFGRWIRLKSRLRPPWIQNQCTFSLTLLSFVNSVRAFLVPESDLGLNFTIKLSMYLAPADAILELPDAQYCKIRESTAQLTCFQSWAEERSLLEVCIILLHAESALDEYIQSVKKGFINLAKFGISSNVSK